MEEAGLPDTVGNMQAALRLLDGETALDTVLELARESQSEQDAVGQLASETADASGFGDCHGSCSSAGSGCK